MKKTKLTNSYKIITGTNIFLNYEFYLFTFYIFKNSALGQNLANIFWGFYLKNNKTWGGGAIFVIRLHTCITVLLHSATIYVCHFPQNLIHVYNRVIRLHCVATK